MNVLIFLTLLCLGMASAAPKVENAEAQSDLSMVNMVEDTINNAELEKTPEVLEKDNQEQSEEQGIQTTRNASDYITLQMKISRGLFGMMKGVTRKALLKKAVKGIGKKAVGEILNPGNVGDIVYGIGKQILEGKKTEESLPTPEVATETVEEF